MDAQGQHDDEDRLTPQNPQHLEEYGKANV